MAAKPLDVLKKGLKVLENRVRTLLHTLSHDQDPIANAENELRMCSQ
jgi:hypothetical protein